MAQRLSFEPLAAEHAGRVEALARALRGRGGPPLGAALREAESLGAGRGLGLWDGGRLVGYLVARSRPAGLRGAAGEVVAVEELGVRPAYRWALGEFLARWCDELARRGPLPPLEVLAAASALDALARRRAPLCAELGYRLAERELLPDERAWLRLEPLAAGADPRALGVSQTHRVADLDIDVRIARSELEWARLEPFWNPLLEATPGASGYQSYEYLRAWWRCFGAERRLWIASLWSGAELLGIAALCVHARRGALRGARELQFLGAGVGGAPSFVDRPLFLFGRHADVCREALLRSLEAASHWDALALHEQALQEPSAQALLELARRRRWPRGTRPDAPSVFARTHGSYEAFLGARSRQFRRLLRVSQRRLEEQGALRAQRYSGEAAVREALARYCELERASWKHGTAAAVGASPRREFYAALAAALAPKGEFEVSFLLLGERPLAAALLVLHGGRMHVLEVVYDREFARCSPGTVLQGLDFEYAFARGCSEVDLRAGQLAHKQHWSEELRHTEQLWIARPSARRWLEWAVRLQLAPRLKTVLRRARERLRERAGREA